jgi:hypothetical protein
VKAPDILLEIDHIDPASKGGTNDLLNLTTSCQACKAGKSDRKLTDDSVVERQRKQLEELQKRKEQIEMMLEWQREVSKLDDFTVNQLAEFWAELIPPYSLNDNGKRTLKKLLSKYIMDEIMEAMKISINEYVEYFDNVPSRESVEIAWKKVRGICSVKQSEKEKPYLRDILYIRGILRNRLYYLDENLALKILEECVNLGADFGWLKKHAIAVRNRTEWRTELEEFIQNKKLPQE